MQINSEIFERIRFLVGDMASIQNVNRVPARAAFDEEIIDFLDHISSGLMHDPEAKKYSDIISFAFFIRKAAIKQYASRIHRDEDKLVLGRGVSFHIAPSNVAINFAYSMCAALMFGNICIVRVSGKQFPQTKIVADTINLALSDFPAMKDYVYLVSYERDRMINDAFSSMCDVRIVWGGDNTIQELRKSMLQPRATEICFADRYSLAVIDADAYMLSEDKARIVRGFYNDTYLSDQNACTSPRIVMWVGKNIEEAKEIFWKDLHEYTEKNYGFQDIQGVNKFTSLLLALEAIDGAELIKDKDNLITRIKLNTIDENMIDHFSNSGFFFEYSGKDPEELFSLCDDVRCQTISYYGDKKMFENLLKRHPKGVDRIVPIGHSMDFDLIWDGYDLTERLTRIIIKK